MSLERDIEDEVRFHLEMRTRANIEGGMSPEEARLDAERRFGDPEKVRQAGRMYLKGLGSGSGSPTSPSRAVRERRTLWERLLSLASSLRQDFVVGIRMLVRHPFLTGAAVLSLALGIGANTANFSIFYGVLIRDLPFERAGGLVFVDAWNPERGDGDAPVTWADLQALRSSGVFDGVEAFDTRSFTLTGGDRPERVAGAAVTPGLFRLLGTNPQTGRLFLPEEGAEAGFESVALISDRLWKGRFGGDPDLLGKTVHINGREITVVGIMDPGFRFPEREDLWLPLGTDDPTDHMARSMIGVGRLREGTGFAAARDVAVRWSEDAATQFPETHGGWTLRAQPFRYGFVDAGARRFLSLLVAAVGLVLLLACANVANLLLARASDRRQELAVRSSLGAGRLRLVQQVLVESLALGLTGGALGVLVAKLWLDFFSGAIPEEMTFWMEVGIDRTILLYALSITLGTSLLFGLLPAFQASRANLGESLRQGSRSVLGGRGRARAALVIAEVGLAVILLPSATLMVRSFMALQHADPGFEDASLLSFRIVQAGDQYDDPAARGVYFREVAQRLGALPGAMTAAATSAIPADDGGSPIRVLPEGTPEDEALYASAILSTRGFFETLGVELMDGRAFSASEELDPDADVVIVGKRVADRLWPGEDPMGRSVVLPETGTFRVIGVAPDLQYEEFGEDLEGARLQLHFPYGIGGNRGMAVLLRATGDPGRLIPSVREELASIDPSLAPYDILTMPERRALTTWEQELFGKSFAVFGAIALLLALCGIYGVIAYSVASRTREIGIRIALGARPGGVQSQVVKDALTLAGLGAGLGLVVSLAFARALRGIVFGVNTADPLVFVGSVAAMLLTAVAAGWLPAHRAARVDPTEALRAE